MVKLRFELRETGFRNHYALYSRRSVVAFSKKSDQISHVLLVDLFMYVFIHSFLPGAGKLEVNDTDTVFELLSD